MKFSGNQMRKVTLLKKTVTENEYNEQVATWPADTANSATDDTGKIYMEWWDQGGREKMEGGLLVAVKDVRARCYYIDGLNEKDYRIKKDGVEYDIEHVKEIGRREGQQLMLMARDNGTA